MNKFRMVAAVAFVVSMLVGTGTVFAHHAFASEYDARKPVTLKGTIVKMLWINPDGWLQINVKEPDGTVSSWAIEFGSPGSLLKKGWRKDDLPVGAEVTVTGHLAKNGTKTAHSSTVKLPDGRELFSGAPDER